MLMFCTFQKLDRAAEMIHNLGGGNTPSGCGMEWLATSKLEGLIQ